MEEDYVVLDIETTGLNPFFGDRVTCVCAKHQDQVFKEVIFNRGSVDLQERVVLENFLDWLGENITADTLLVTKNGKLFDIPFLVWRSHKLGVSRDFDVLLRMKQFDLQEVTKKWIGLDDMASLYGVKNKTGNGKNAVFLWRDGKFNDLLEYCFNDVLVTEEVFRVFRRLNGGGVRG